MAKRRFPRVYAERGARLVRAKWYWDRNEPISAMIYQLGPAGCGVQAENYDLETGQRVYIVVPDKLGTSTLNVRAKIVWKRPELHEPFCRYGLEFLWVRRESGELWPNPVLLALNKILAPTGFELMAGTSSNGFRDCS